MIKKSLQQFCEENQLGALLKEWDYEKNCDLRPENISYGSAQKVWWKCDKGHSWQMDVNHRTGPDKNKCPICSNRRILVGYNDLATTNPEIASEWHPTNNGTLNPQDVTRYNNKKVWWLGKCGHEWQAVISSRTGNQSCGCPYCSNQKTLTGYNDLATTHPALASEWHPTKNLPLTPQKISAGSAKKAWWLGKCGHEWQAVIASRARDGVGCPYCAKKKVIKGVNDLATTNPELAAAWDYEKNDNLKPEDIFAGTANKVWWKCSKGHSWKADTHSRNRGNGCPYCSNQKVLKGYNDLQTRNPRLAAEWHPTKNGDITPSDVLPNSNKKYWWLGLCGHEWQSVLNSRNQGCGCPICSKRKRTSFPEQAIFHYARKYYPDTVNGEKDAIGMELDIYIPSEKIAIEYDGSMWHNDINAEERERKKNQKCKDAGILLIRMREEGLTEYDDCYCILCKAESSDSELNEEIKILMSELGVGNADIDIFRDRYDIYSSFVTDLKQNSLAVLYPEIAADWHKTKNGDLKPDMFPAGSELKIWWECPKGHEWQAIISSRTKQGTGCPYCAGLRVLPGYNDLETISPQLAAEWHPTKNGDMKPNTVAPFSNKKYWWLGKCGHEYQATPNARSQGSGCPYCVGKKVLVGFNDLATTNPELAAEWDQEANGALLPTMVTKGSQKKVSWICKQGHKWKAIIASRTRGNGCSKCAIEAASHRYGKAVKCIETGNVYYSIAEAEKQTGVCRSTICNVCNGKAKTAGGYHWAYCE